MLKRPFRRMPYRVYLLCLCSATSCKTSKSRSSIESTAADQQTSVAKVRQEVWKNIESSAYDVNNESKAANRKAMPALKLPPTNESPNLMAADKNTRTFQPNEKMDGRSKTIHAFGVTALVKFVPTSEKSGYTGLFATGSDFGIVRLSLAVKPAKYFLDKSQISNEALKHMIEVERSALTQTPFVNNFTPGMAIKFYLPTCSTGSSRTEESVNMHVMNSVDGQDNVNFFAHSFTNVLPAPASLKAKMGAYFFEKGMKSLPADDPNPGHLTVDHVASVDNKGCAVQKARTPYKILFQPDSEVQGHYRNLMDEYVLKYIGFGGIVKEDVDFRKVFIPKNKEDDRIFRPGQTLFHVWGRAEKVATDGQTASDAEDSNPASVGYKRIGTVVLDSYFVASDFGDTKLHFPHHTKLKAN